MTKPKSEYVSIAVGQWVVAFRDEFFNDTKSLAENVAGLKHKGAGWDWAADRVLTVRRVDKVMPNTYDVPHRERRCAVVAACESEEAARNLAASLIAVGAEADSRINAEMYRRVAVFACKQRAAAAVQIRKLVPHVFGGAINASKLREQSE
jgi:hypothetical protein